jgi:hypothetical protein
MPADALELEPYITADEMAIGDGHNSIRKATYALASDGSFRWHGKARVVADAPLGLSKESESDDLEPPTLSASALRRDTDLSLYDVDEYGRRLSVV